MSTRNQYINNDSNSTFAVKYKETADERNCEIESECFGGLHDGYVVKYYCHKYTEKIETNCAIIIFFVMLINSIIIQKLQDYVYI